MISYILWTERFRTLKNSLINQEHNLLKYSCRHQHLLRKQAAHFAHCWVFSQHYTSDIISLELNNTEYLGSINIDILKISCSLEIFSQKWSWNYVTTTFVLLIYHSNIWTVAWDKNSYPWNIFNLTGIDAIIIRYNIWDIFHRTLMTTCNRIFINRWNYTWSMLILISFCLV